MANYVLVHGGNMRTDTWNQLAGRNDYPPGMHLGGRIWDGTVAVLEAHHHLAYATTLIDETSTSLTGHIEQISSLITEEDLKNTILVGHSYGGMVITGVAAALTDRIRCLVYLDAALPDPGQSLYDLLKASVASGPEPVLPEPAPAYVEKLQYEPAALGVIPKTYILCTKSEFIGVTSIAKRKIAAAPEGWTYLELPASHVPMADLPDEFNNVLLRLAE